jgi:hypothetical protein
MEISLSEKPADDFVEMLKAAGEPDNRGNGKIAYSLTPSLASSAINGKSAHGDAMPGWQAIRSARPPS